jgi:hypothetical protein
MRRTPCSKYDPGAAKVPTIDRRIYQSLKRHHYPVFVTVAVARPTRTDRAATAVIAIDV